MASPALARLTQLLDTKKLAGTISRPLDHARAVTPTGLGEMDDVLAGGWPQGHLSEVHGPVSSGRTSVVLSTLASVTRKGGVVALVDVSDRFDALSAEAAGVVLDRVLWVRGPSMSSMASAAPEAPWGRPTRGVGERALQTGIRAFDLIVRAGGFAVVVCDIADVPARDIRTLPAATWFRLAHAIEGRDTVGLLTGAHPMGRSAGGVSVALRARGVWTGQSAQSRRLHGVRMTPQVAQRVTRVSGVGGASCSSASYATR